MTKKNIGKDNFLNESIHDTFTNSIKEQMVLL